MIIPPVNTTSFYAAVFKEPAANLLIGLIAKSFAERNEIGQVLVTSLDFESDVIATVELQNGLTELVKQMNVEHNVKTKFNPLFLPSTTSLYDVVDVDESGDISTIDGFNSPFTLMTVKIDTDQITDMADAKVMFRQFELPQLHVSLESHKEVSIS